MKNPPDTCGRECYRLSTLLVVLILPVVIILGVLLPTHLSQASSSPIGFTLDYEDSGGAVTGRDLWALGLQWHNVANTGHRLDYAYHRAGRQGVLAQHGLDMAFTLAQGHALLVSGRYGEVKDTWLADPRGRSRALGVRYALSGQQGSASQTLAMGVEAQRYNHDLDYFGHSRYPDFVQLVHLVLDYQAQAEDRWGDNVWSLNLLFSPGDLSGENSDNAFQIARPGAESRYHVVRLGYERRHRLNHGYTWVVRGRLQQADGALLPSEQFALGGRSSLRGFDEWAYAGDRGYWASSEIRSPVFSLSPGGNGGQQLQLLTFLEWGHARQLERQLHVPRSKELSALGIGLRYQWRDHFSLHSDFGWQLQGRERTVGEDTRLHLHAQWRY